MEKRDLKADLELCKQYQDNIGPWISEDGFPTKHLIEVAVFLNQAREGWPHAIERALDAEGALTRFSDSVFAQKARADKAEALARELVDVLERVTPRYLTGRLELDLDLVHEANGLLKKAKEVLGDE